MTINETIFFTVNPKWRGETIYEAQGVRYINPTVDGIQLGPIPIPLYDSDPAAWTPELFQWIENQGLALRFVYHLFPIVDRYGDRELPEYTEDYGPDTLFDYTKVTPLQKATALARAIEERE